MTEKIRRYEKIDFLGEGQVRIDIVYVFVFYIIIYIEIYCNLFCNVYIIQKCVCIIYVICCIFQFATVYKARDIETKNIVAVKKVSYFLMQITYLSFCIPYNKPYINFYRLK